MRLSMAVGGFKITAPPLWLVVALPLCSFTAAVLSISAFGANTPIWVSNALAVTALLRNKRSTWPILLFLAVAADYASNVCTGTPVIGIGFTTCDGFEILLVALLAGSTGIASPIDQIWPMARLALVCLLRARHQRDRRCDPARIGFWRSFFCELAHLVSRHRLRPADHHPFTAELDRSNFPDGSRALCGRAIHYSCLDRRCGGLSAV